MTIDLARACRIFSDSMSRLALVLLLTTVVSCADDDAVPDATEGPATLTINNEAVSTLVLSSPEGIVCGHCSPLSPAPCPVPEGGTTCSMDVPPDTHIKLSLYHWGIYFGLYCGTTDPDVAITEHVAARDCELDVPHAVTVTIYGAEAVR